MAWTSSLINESSLQILLIVVEMFLKCHNIRNFDVDLQNTLKIISKKYASIRMNKIYMIFKFKKEKYS